MAKYLKNTRYTKIDSNTLQLFEEGYISKVHNLRAKYGVGRTNRAQRTEPGASIINSGLRPNT